jgi:hypothetical protein
MAELVDAHGSGPCAFGCGGSSPLLGTIIYSIVLIVLFYLFPQKEKKWLVNSLKFNRITVPVLPALFSRFLFSRRLIISLGSFTFTVKFPHNYSDIRP